MEEQRKLEAEAVFRGIRSVSPMAPYSLFSALLGPWSNLYRDYGAIWDTARE
jgi:hypothetical protein